MNTVTSPNYMNCSWKEFAGGAILQCMEAATLGMPFEVWKTRMGKFRNEGTLEAFVNVYKRGGVQAFWQGGSAKMVECATKGAILVFSKESILSTMKSWNFNDTISGFVAGAGAGLCQTIVLGPTTFLITASVTSSDNKLGIYKMVSNVWKSSGIQGFYPGGTAIAIRQATNWASRQGIFEFIRSRMLVARIKKLDDVDVENQKLTPTEETIAGIIAGALSTWNHPFEVARVQMQSAANEGKPKQNIIQVFRYIIQNDGVTGLFKGIVPRIGLAIWQTLFMSSGVKIIQQYFPSNK